jgi:hypothetical protein
MSAQASALGEIFARETYEHAGGMKLRTGYANHRHGKNLCARWRLRTTSIRFTKPPRRAKMRLPRGGFLRSGSARLGRSQKDGLPFAAGKQALAVQGHQLAQGRGSLVAAPSNRDREWTPRRATFFYLPVCRSSAQPSPGPRITLFWVLSFLRSVQSPLSA